jgi:hypothetical protein
MKTIITFAALSIFAIPSFLGAQPIEQQSLQDEVANARFVLDQHQSNCKDGSRGWWLKLSTTPSNRYERGGISTASGQYNGCGTCNDCRTKLNQDIDAVLKSSRQYCESRGGVVKSENRGTGSEDIQPTVWTLSSTNIDIVCEKWVPCE